MEDLKQFNTTLDYNLEREALRRFLFTFETKGSLKYMGQIKALPQTKHLAIDVEDILEDGNTELYTGVLSNTMRYREMVYEIVDEMIKEEEIDMPAEDLFFEHRKIRVQERDPGKSVFTQLPKGMLRYYSVDISRKDRQSFDEIGPDRIGGLVAVRGIVSRTSEVHPSVWVAVYVCDQCTSELFQEVEGESFMPLSECPTERCRSGRVKGTLHLQTRPSKFRAKQVLQIQEMPQDVQPGRIPRTLVADVYETQVRLAVPGMEVLLAGVLLPRPNEGLQRMRMGLLSDTYILGAKITLLRGNLLSKTPKSTGMGAEMGVEMGVGDGGVAGNELETGSLGYSVEMLSQSIAPEIAGLKDVKKLLLLMLIGGDTYTEGGMRIRGEINVLLVGDPGVAKSQLLKAVARISPRGVFTTGRGASGAGLTACVARDPETGEYRIEGGALVMSDGGVCCIDEFDKMHEGDRSCVHEAMEQHRISIAKAGINTTLNARCSVLAAANPIKGRYIDRKSVAWNAGLPSALLSRFDAVRVLKDTAGDADKDIAAHVLGVHQSRGVLRGCLTPTQLSAEIARRKQLTTTLGPGVRARIVDAYVCERARAGQLTERASAGTARKVLSVLRFAQALAKAEGRTMVVIDDVEEVLRLLGGDSRSVYDAIVSMPGEDFGTYRVVELEGLYKETSRFARSEIHQCIEEQVAIGAWILNKNRLTIPRA
ncbi:DNA replication licensing factor MCM7 [Nematocida homosporus]|uniref:DNA replication licensing factor MCM7 n=1 Tax=Nematocida homosporus TaxID=1912981 RepID=UPI00221FE28C|nr:DNA replication licensing factor MCM7 [Nematocida homosporus]KAI5186480.1 DNA replication licensing factor MCM7 [Nematocida homosporus]